VFAFQIHIELSNVSSGKPYGFRYKNSFRAKILLTYKNDVEMALRFLKKKTMPIARFFVSSQGSEHSAGQPEFLTKTGENNSREG